MADVHDLESLPPWPSRPADSHKGDFGRVLIVGGSVGMAGSVSLSGMAALRGGAGLVTLAVPRSILATVAAYEPSYMTIGLPDDSQGRLTWAAAPEVLERSAGCQAVACGPGLGRAPAIVRLVRDFIGGSPSRWYSTPSALHALADRPRGYVRRPGPAC